MVGVAGSGVQESVAVTAVLLLMTLKGKMRRINSQRLKFQFVFSFRNLSSGLWGIDIK
jgi:hypothetical protein